MASTALEPSRCITEVMALVMRMVPLASLKLQVMKNLKTKLGHIPAPTRHRTAGRTMLGTLEYPLRLKKLFYSLEVNRLQIFVGINLEEGERKGREPTDMRIPKRDEDVWI